MQPLPSPKTISKQATVLGPKFQLQKHSEGSLDVVSVHSTKTSLALMKVEARSTYKVRDLIHFVKLIRFRFSNEFC